MIDVNKNVLMDLENSFILPSKPEILDALQKEMASSEVNLFNVANIIADDTGACAAILKVINSPVYGLNRTIYDAKQAVMFLGLESTVTIVTQYLLKKAFDQRFCTISLQKFWEGVDEVSFCLSSMSRLFKSQVPPENLHLLGMFHSVGMPVMASRFNDYPALLEMALTDRANTLEYHENQRYGVSSVVVGYYLASTWHLPQCLCEQVLRQNELAYLHEARNLADKQQFAMLKLAVNICHEYKYFHSTPEWSAFSTSVINTLNLSEDDYCDLKDDIAEHLLDSF